MKKFIFASMAAGLVLASCSNEEFDVKPAGQEGTVTFTASLPASVASRLYSDGQTAKNLQYAVYLAGEQAPLIEGTAVFANLKATVSTTLATGKSYDILFWAQADEAPYAFDAETQNVTITYDGITANNESLDAFFFAEKDLAVNGPVNKTVTLTRPFAQLNIGTNDFAAAESAGVKVTESSIKVSTYSTLNLYDGTVSDEVDAEFALAAIPQDETFPVENYEYLSMAYVLVDAEKQLVDVTLGIDASEANAPVFAGVPVQRNYRTNIYGALLTNPAIFDVEINPDYEGDFDFGSLVAPGVLLNEADKTYTITAPQGLQWLSSQSNGKANAFAGYTIKLGNDIDMAGQEFTPIAKGAYFGGTFDGDGHTIANLTVSDPDCSGLVWSNRGMMKNITMKDVNVTGNFKVGAIAGDGLCGHFDNCVVDGGTITSTPRMMESGKYDDGNNAGGITGYLSAESNASMTNCTVRNVTVMAFRSLGSVVGTLNGGSGLVFTGNKAENCQVIANQLLDNYVTFLLTDIGKIYGRNRASGGTVSDNTDSEVTTKTLRFSSNTVNVADEQTFAIVANMVNSGSTFEGKTIKLTSDIIFTAPAPAIGYFVNTGGAADAVSAPFKGTFDGQNHTISNFETIVTEYKGAAGFFGYVADGAVIKNVTLKNPKITGTAYTGALIGKADKGSSYVTISDVTIDGATVTSAPAKGTNGEFDGGNNVGGLVGITQYGMEVKGCTVKNSTITGYAKVGGMFGLCCNLNQSGASNHTVYENNSVSNTTVKQSLVNAYEAQTPSTIGAIYGQLFGSSLPESNTATDVMVTPSE